ncbi:MAG: hypothetical protein EDX89_16015 [Acidobacteria bacterium]|nr:MAG: hypothetical protein EDX89_16015 [Acidobacteriota bacterium]MCE7956765.1 hypothetical protein [Acidobacteria bacterium ACB2]
MGLLKDFFRIDADRRAAHQALRQEAVQRRLRVEELTAEAKRKRDEINMLEEGLGRLAEDLVRVEQEILELEQRREEADREEHERKVAAVKAALESDRRENGRVARDFRSLRAEFHAERTRLLAQADTGRMMDNYFQIETFLKDASQPIPDAARRALLKERTDLLAKIGPLVAPPPSPDSVLKAMVTYSGIEGANPRAVVAVGLPDESEPSDPTDLAATLLYGAHASVVERLGAGAPKPSRRDGALVYEVDCEGRSPEATAIDLLFSVEEGLRKAASAAAVKCELIGIYVEPEIAQAVFPARA